MRRFRALGVFAADHDGEGVVEAERRANVEIEAVAIGVANGVVDGGGIVRGSRFTREWP